MLSALLAVQYHSVYTIIIIIIFSFTELCQELALLENGVITYAPDMTPDFNQGTVATHTCNPGFILDGLMTRVCIGLAIWTGTAPVCRRKIHSCLDSEKAYNYGCIINLCASLLQ